MELARSFLWAAALALLGARGRAAYAASERAATSNPGDESPIVRIVDILKDVQKHAEADAKKDEALYEKFVCWGRSVIDQKTLSNAEAEAELLSLKSYISDLDGGRIELTSERVDLEKEIADIVASLEVAAATRKKERSDFEGAEEELAQGVAALETAINVLQTATAGHETGELLAVRAKLGHGVAADAKESTVLSRATELGEKFLERGDALFLRKLLAGEVPEWDWNKLNRKATFKMSYKARSSKIEDVLVKLLEMFRADLADAQQKETESQDLYDKLTTSKETEKESKQAALNKMATESGAKGLSRSQAAEKVDLLTKQVSNDKKYLEQVKTELAHKKTEWQERATLRAKELAAMSKAIDILHNDDARDMFKRSLHSQGYSLFQTGLLASSRRSRATTAVTTNAVAARGRGAAAALQGAVAVAHDARLTLLAERLSSGEPFDEVITAIEGMLATLTAEEKSDDEMKENCESSRAENTRSAVKVSRDIDEASEIISSSTADIAELEAEIKQKREEVVSIDEQLASAEAQRNEEHATFVSDQKDDEDASNAVVEAIAVLDSFYKDNGLMLVQKRKDPVPVVAGEAPPPPPSTWDEPYGGRVSESHGIVMIMTMIKDDILEDKAKGLKEENEAVELYNSMVTSLNTEKTTLNSLIDQLTTTMGSKSDTVSETKMTRDTKKGELDSLMKTIKAEEPGCNFFTVNYLVRKRNRQIEMDGLVKAKIILQGGQLSEGGRDLGDATLLVEARQHLEARTTRHSR